MLRDRFRRILVLVVFLAVPATVSWGQPAAPDLSDPFFDDTIVHDIKLQINTKDWESLKVNYLDNTVYPCWFQWTNQTVRNVGIRSRGLGSRSGIKPGLRVDFDYYTTDQKFLGLKSVILRNNTQDASNMRERASMLFFRRMEVIASREAHARLFINSEYAGVYTIVESIDKNFLMKNFGENDGHLYEYRFDIAAPLPYDFGYRGPDPALYAPLPFKPQTREDDPQGEVLERLFWTANEAGAAVWRTAMEEFLDLRKFLKHVAIESVPGRSGRDCRRLRAQQFLSVPVREEEPLPVPAVGQEPGVLGKPEPELLHLPEYRRRTRDPPEPSGDAGAQRPRASRVLSRHAARLR